MNIRSIVNYVGGKVLDSLGPVTEDSHTTIVKDPKIGRTYPGKGEYLGDGVFVDINAYMPCTYVEGDHVLYFGYFTEPGCDDKIIYSEDLDRWQPPYDKDPVSPAKREQILAKIQMSFRGPFTDRGVRPGQYVPLTLPRRWVVWTVPPQ
jgi:hypothetical protein